MARLSKIRIKKRQTTPRSIIMQPFLQLFHGNPGKKSGRLGRSIKLDFVVKERVMTFGNRKRRYS